MKRRVFRSKIVYWISIVYFLLVSISFVIYLINITILINDKLTYFFILLAAIFTITILINLIEKFRNATLFISIYFSIVIIFNIFSVLKFYLVGNLYLTELRNMLFNIIFLVLVNYFKIDNRVIKNSEEIDQIGNENFES